MISYFSSEQAPPAGVVIGMMCEIVVNDVILWPMEFKC